MPKFVLAYHGSREMSDDPAEMGPIMEAWNTWFTSLGAAVADGGAPIATSKTVGPGGAVTDAASDLSGYSIVEASDLDATLAMAKGCPVLDGGGTVEVCQTIEM